MPPSVLEICRGVMVAMDSSWEIVQDHELTSRQRTQATKQRYILWTIAMDHPRQKGKRLRMELKTGVRVGGISIHFLNNRNGIFIYLQHHYILTSPTHRPVQWSKSSVIFTAHPTQPVVTGRHFSSSKQFFLPSPTPLNASPTPYDPPSAITVGPDDLWLFAYFPRRDGEGIGCLWKRGPQIDNWGVKECWTYPKGGGVVTASWLDSNREVSRCFH